VTRFNKLGHGFVTVDGKELIFYSEDERLVEINGRGPQLQGYPQVPTRWFVFGESEILFLRGHQGEIIAWATIERYEGALKAAEVASRSGVYPEVERLSWIPLQGRFAMATVTSWGTRFGHCVLKNGRMVRFLALMRRMICVNNDFFQLEWGERVPVDPALGFVSGQSRIVLEFVQNDGGYLEAVAWAPREEFRAAFGQMQRNQAEFLKGLSLEGLFQTGTVVWSGPYYGTVRLGEEEVVFLNSLRRNICAVDGFPIWGNLFPGFLGSKEDPEGNRRIVVETISFCGKILIKAWAPEGWYDCALRIAGGQVEEISFADEESWGYPEEEGEGLSSGSSRRGGKDRSWRRDRHCARGMKRCFLEEEGCDN